METYLALFEPGHDAGGYVVTFPDFGYGVTQGENEAESMEMARDLLMLTIGDYIRDWKRLPPPRRHRGAKFRLRSFRLCNRQRSTCLPHFWNRS
jgi:predicted RNase H-like HicB family nuclease